MASQPFQWRFSYLSREQRVLTFPSEGEIRRATSLCWEDPECIGMPHNYLDALRMVVPVEAVELFQERGFVFRVSEHLTGGDYRSADLIERRDGGLSISDFTTKYWTEHPRRITFQEKDGALWFAYEERVLDLQEELRERWKVYKTEGEVPQDVVGQGEDAIRLYVEEEVTAYLEDARDQEARHEAYASNLNFQVEFQHQGVTLKGKIVSALDNTLLVRLEEPYQGERLVHYGLGNALAGRRIFDDQGQLTEGAIHSAQRWLLYIYDEQFEYEQKQEVINLADSLNSSGQE